MARVAEQNPPQEDDFTAAVRAAQAEIAAAIERGGLRNDALRYPLVGLHAALGVFPELVASVKAAAGQAHPKPHPPGQEVIDAIERSVRGVAFRIGADLCQRTRVTVVVGMVGAAMLGGAVGYIGGVFSQAAPPACVQTR